MQQHAFTIPGRSLLCLGLLVLCQGGALAANIDSRHTTMHNWQTRAVAKPCPKVPHCNAAQVLSYGTSGWECVPLALPNCASNEVLTRHNDKFQCISP